jgi:hypothetical protein
VEEDLCDANQETLRINYMIIPTAQILIVLKSAKTTPEVEEAKIEALERSQTAPIQEENEIHVTEITEDELDVYSSIFKDKLKLSPFLKEQFNLIASLPFTSPEIVEALALNLPPPKRKS